MTGSFSYKMFIKRHLLKICRSIYWSEKNIETDVQLYINPNYWINKKVQRKREVISISYISFSYVKCVFFCLKCHNMIWYSVIVENGFVYQGMNAFKICYLPLLIDQSFLYRRKLCWSNWPPQSVLISNICRSLSWSI